MGNLNDGSLDDVVRNLFGGRNKRIENYCSDKGLDNKKVKIRYYDNGSIKLLANRKYTRHIHRIVQL
ncbi:hypothetical protein COZ55_02100 [archaeon CG_4_8_14_3_um_filter_38_5]|nr:MAG: hypothetical protein COS83_01160 [archaeon CG07_land_8_20_14_0_80_38_8]PIU88585.1 MAG: hypothetical protein COS64_03040 [archaeon CG06_land_8_20_14_3_00_37_11]PIX42448.1 MAG: hypothetical protein COZ55_02100 [archaeon CG_4_8_14_3_um_filter_38_5]